ncbi:phage tail sheath subtilisin-like domain-containing protein, partial [Marine Group I thaumarchaeote]|nr:phage tail sheath subtilisin-like domain-containing protein [Marine Group I thaumarchaeote]
MAERIVSPGVFTRERDLSFLPAGIAAIGACIIGPTVKGPAFVPTVVTNFSEFEEMFGSTDSRYYTPYAVEQYLRSAGSVTIVRVLNTGGYTADYVSLKLSSSAASVVRTVAVLAPSRGGTNGTGDLSLCLLAATESAYTSQTLTVNGTDVTETDYSISFNTSSANYIDQVISSDPQVQKSGQDTVAVYLYKNFKYHQSSYGWDTGTSANHSGSISIGGVGDFEDAGYSNASTPSIQSQLINNSRYNLFKVNTRSHGSDVNNKFKVVILNVKAAGTVAGSDYGQFSLQLRQTGLNDNGLTTDNIAEQWDSLNFDPKSTNFFARRIGDRYVTIDANGKLTYEGDWNNRSKHIYVSDFSDISNGSIPKVLVPMGHSSISAPLSDGDMPNWIFKVTQSNAQDEFDSNVLYGHDYKNGDAEQYLVPVNDFTGGTNVSMSLEDMFGHDDASVLGTTEGTDYASATSSISLTTSHLKQRKFVVPFQGGFDGDNPANPKLTGASIKATNTQGFDISSATATGAVAYKKAINAISNPDEFDINMLVTPGILHNLHPKITNHAIAKCEERGDAFYIFDCGKYGGSIADATAAISALDTNYAATYYPWVKIVDRATALPVWVPPSVVLPGVIAFTDQVAHEWFAPAGLNRGGLTTVLEAQTRLTHDERDELY